MKEFLKGQFDYIYFFYGFSFFLLALICFTIDRDKLRKLPWILLGLFGLFHGLSEWLDMFMVIAGKNNILLVFNLFSLSVSYICLFEFARIGLFRLKGKTISSWVYPLIVIALPLGYKYGMDGWFTTVRYFLGFPSAYFAARTIYEFSKAEQENKRPIIALSVMMALYAVFTGLVVPEVAFIPASIINFGSFYNAFGVPIQMVRGISTLCAALALWFYSSTLPISGSGYKPYGYSIRFMPTKWMIALTLVVFIGAGWIFTNYLDYYAGIKMIKRNESKTGSQLNMLTKELALLGRAALSMSKSSAVRGVASFQQPQNMERVDAVLRQFKVKFGALDCALLDKQGMPIAYIGDGGSEIKMGKSYASRPYFRDALSWKNGYYFKLGPAYNERIYYVSYPIMDTAGKISGVAVIVKNIHAEPLFQYRLFSIVITFLVCVIAIIFFIVLRRRESLINLIERVHSQLEEVDRMKTDFISVVSHELRTPLTSIKNAADILMKGGPAKRAVDERERELLKIVLDNVDRQTRMVSDLLDVSKIEAGVMPVFPEPTDITELIKQVIAALQPLADDKKIDIALAIDTPEKIVYADEEHVRRILSNLTVNAIKFTANKGKVTVKAEDAGKEVRITVSDTGIGISAADKEKLFGKFYRSCSVTAQERRGCGLGLAIAKGLVEAQKGRIWVESQPGEGSSFYFTLPKLKKDNS